MIIVIISALVALISLIIIIIKLKNDNLLTYKIKIELAEKEIEVLLSKKLSLLINLQKSFSEREDDVTFNFVCDGLDKENNEFKLNTILNKAYKELKDFIDSKRSFIPDEEIKKNLETLYQIDIECIATKNFYNEVSIVLNNKIKKFPNNIIARSKGISTKELYNDPVEEEFEILKKK